MLEFNGGWAHYLRAKDLQAAYELTLFWNALMHIK